MKDVPVHIANRCVLRNNLLEKEAVRMMLKTLIAKHAERCHVRVIQFSIRRNHLHLLVSQEFSGHDRGRRLGIASFCRNVFSAAALFGHTQNDTAGRFWERTYRSCIRSEGEEALQAFAYISLNGMHHDPNGSIDDEDTGNRVYLEGEPDGVITHILGVFAPLSVTTHERGTFIRELLLDWRDQADVKRKEVSTARSLLCRHRELLDLHGAHRSVPLSEWLGTEAVERARRKLRSWVPPRAGSQSETVQNVAGTGCGASQEVDPAPLD